MVKSTTRRAKVNQGTLARVVEGGGKRLSLKNLRGIVSPVSSKTENVTIRLSGAWLELWHQVRGELTELSDSEILRQAIALRAALVAVDADGKRPTALITFTDDNGEAVTVDLEAHVGIKEEKPAAPK
mgnify:CR=1 FL=1|jgi:hypothetical protein